MLKTFDWVMCTYCVSHGKKEKRSFKSVLKYKRIQLWLGWGWA